MAVYKQNYKRYDGALTNPRWRFTILPRFSFQTAFEARTFTVFYVLCFVPSIIALLVVYLRSNADILNAAGLNIVESFPIDSRFFLPLFKAQSFLTFLLAMFLGPGLVSPDLTNNALPLYLSRPFSRHEYVLGKLSVIVTLASLITWVPGLLVFLVQSNLEANWMTSHLRIAAAIFIGSWIWIVLASLLAIAVSAWVKWKPVAAGVMFGVFFVAATFGELSNEILELNRGWGMLMNITEVMNMIWEWLFNAKTTYRTLPFWSGFISVGVFCGASLLMLWKKIRACEVVR
jgi:ABC-2 type transport system permease protein